MNLAKLIRAQIPDDGNWLHGFADLRGKVAAKYAAHPWAIAIARRLDDAVVDALAGHGPTQAYYDLYTHTNRELDRMTAKLSAALTATGIAHTTVPATVSDEELTAAHRETLSFDFSHKLAATSAGLGWIGKTALLVTPAFGPRVRLATVLVSEPLPISAEPVVASKCGECSLCVASCPVSAATGKPWRAGERRDVILDAFACRRACRSITAANIGRDESLCGICLAACPIGKRTRSSGA